MNEFDDLLMPPSGDAHLLSTTKPAALLPLGCGQCEDITPTSSAKPLWQRKRPSYVRQQELPWHRTALEMAARGYTAEEIAARIGCSPPCVQDVLKQPQYQQTQVDLIRRESDKDYEVCEVIKSNVVLAVKALASIVNDSNSRPVDVIAASRELLDRRYGKPNQPMNRGTDVDLNALSDRELAAMLPTAGTGTSV